MQVSKNNISQFITSNNTCFVIPVYQRNYDWKEDNCKRLWDDILYLCNNPTATHFLGTICSSGTIAHEKTIIDGQQRLTTISLMIKAIHDAVADPDFKTYLDDKYISNTGYGIPSNHKIKLQLNIRDDSIYRKLLSSCSFTDAKDLVFSMVDSSLYRNYSFFYEHVKNMDIDYILNLMSSLERLIIVELDIENEDPQEIFESLNSTGLDLTDVDLIRNYLLMSLDRETQKRVYESYWYPIEENVGTDNMVRFFLDFYIYTRKSDNLMIKGRRSHISVGHLYEAYREHYRTLVKNDNLRGASPVVTESLLTEMLRCSKIYKRLVFEPRTDMNDLSEIDGTIYSIVYINEAVSSRPVLMYIIENFQNGVIDEKQTQELLNACLSMVFRSKVTKTTGMSGQFVGNMLARLAEDKTDNMVGKFWNAITAGRGDFSFPSDDDFRYALMNRQVFDILRSRGTKYLLYSLEQKSPSSKGLPRYDDQSITIEHIMPKTLSSEWLGYLGESANLHSDFLNKLGNLTLTNNNPEMSNDSFEDKKKWYSESSFHYTRKLSNIDGWSIDSITERGEYLVNKCLELWAFPMAYQSKTGGSNSILSVLDSRKKKAPFRFSMIGLGDGDEIAFIEDPSIIATVVDDTHVMYNGKKYSMSKLASILKGSTDKQYNGPQYFTFEGETLYNLRNEYESYAH